MDEAAEARRGAVRRGGSHGGGGSARPASGRQEHAAAVPGRGGISAFGRSGVVYLPGRGGPIEKNQGETDICDKNTP